MIVLEPFVDAIAPTSGSGRLRFVRSGGRTVLERAFVKTPLRIVTTRQAGDACWVIGATLGGGIVGGDAIDLTIDVAPSARVLLTTQSSTKVFRSLRPASHAVRARVDRGALLAVVPDPVVCFRGADYRQVQRYALHAGADLVHVDWLTSGRHARGERWAFERYASRLEVERDGERLVHDGLELTTADGSISERLGSCNVLCTVLLTGPRLAPFAREAVRACAAAD